MTDEDAFDGVIGQHRRRVDAVVADAERARGPARRTSS